MQDGVISNGGYVMKKWDFYTAKEICPSGWLKRQLEIQAQGLSGNLHKIWPDIKDSAWIGGEREGWERVPYWLDGFIPLAYLLDDKEMISTAKKYIDAIIAQQKPDGWICPCGDDERAEYDTWAVQLISKVLINYYECSGDERILQVVCDILKNYYNLLKSGEICLFEWGKFRWFETFIAINFVYEKFHEEWLVDLAHLLREQGADYNEFAEDWKRPLNFWRLQTHIVNIAMMLKSEAVSCDILDEEYTDNAQKLYDILEKYNGTAVGLFTGDECLSGISAIQGTELCAVVEQMYSYELLYAYTGDEKWAQKLEMLAFNALPAAISDDMWTHQYVQMSNQIACVRFPGKSLFRTDGSEAHIFGLEPNFGCCTANFNQGWPKFALFAFMHDGDKIINSVMIPTELKTDGYSIKLETEYPFKNSAKYIIDSKKDIEFEIRVPSFAENVRINGHLSDERKFSIKSGITTEIQVDFDAIPHLVDRPNDLKTVQYGSLVFSVPIKYERKMLEYERDGVQRKYPYCDYELTPVSDWNYAYCADKLAVCEKDVDSVPFSSDKSPIIIRTKVKKIDWGLQDGYDTVCAKVPESVEPISSAREIELYPYGCAKLRMTEIPLVE